MSDTPGRGDYRWVLFVLAVAVVFGGIVGGVIQYAVLTTLGREIILFKVDVGTAVAFLAAAGVFGHFAHTEVMKLVQ